MPVSAATSGRGVRGHLASAALACVGGFLLLNLAVRAQAFHAGCGGNLAASLALCALGLVVVAGVARPAALRWLLQLLASSLFLFGFHSYRLSSQLLELGITVLALVMLVRLWRGGATAEARSPWPLGLLAVYAALASLSLLLLPARVLEHRLFLEGAGIGRALVSAFPKDPLYPIASVDRLWLFWSSPGLVALQPDARRALPTARPRRRRGGRSRPSCWACSISGRVAARALQPVAALLRRGLQATAVDVREPQLVRLLRRLRAAVRLLEWREARRGGGSRSRSSSRSAPPACFFSGGAGRLARRGR